MTQDCSRYADSIVDLRKSLEELTKNTRNLEKQNDELQDKVRILEQTEFDLTVRLERSEEEKIVLTCELEGALSIYRAITLFSPHWCVLCA